MRSDCDVKPKNISFHITGPLYLIKNWPTEHLSNYTIVLIPVIILDMLLQETRLSE